jgi:phosphonate transport system substrate-binding protein
VTGVLRIGSFLSPALAPLYRRLGDRVAAELRREPRFLDAAPYAVLEPEHLDLAFVCSPPYLARRDRFEAVAAPVPADPRAGGEPVYFSDVVVRADAPWRSFAELRGTVLAYNEPESLSGYHAVRGRLAALGERARFFGRTVEAGFHREALRMVAAGEADAAAVDSHVLALAARDDPSGTAGLRTVAALGPHPIQPFVVSRRLSADEREGARRALVAASDDPLLTGMLLARIVAVDADHSDPVAALLAAADAAGIDLREERSPS